MGIQMSIVNHFNPGFRNSARTSAHIPLKLSKLPHSPCRQKGARRT